MEGNVLVFSHGHFLRVLAARWLALPAGAARHFVLATAALRILGDEHTRDESALRLWHDDHHVVEAHRDPMEETGTYADTAATDLVSPGAVPPGSPAPLRLRGGALLGHAPPHRLL